MGAWQRNEAIHGDTALSYPAVFACVTLIAQDIAKLRLRLVEVDEDGIWTEAVNPAYSPFLRRPNRYQNIIKFVEQWITSKVYRGNAYALKERDQRGIVKAAYVLDPSKVTPLVAEDGAVYYELRRDNLSGVTTPAGIPADTLTVPASEIMHDPMVCLFHPLIGVSPLYACGLSALQGLTMQQTSSNFFAAGAAPGGVLTAPGHIGDDTALRLKDYFEREFTGENAGRIAVVGDGLKYEPMTVNAADSKLIEQLNWTAETICTCYHVPPYMVGIGPHPPYQNSEPLLQQYYSQCLQSLINSFETVLDEGLGLTGSNLGTEFDPDDLIWLDTATRTKAAADGIGSGALAPNEARKKYFGLGPVPGGESPYMQQQNYSLEALTARDSAAVTPAPTPAIPAPVEDEGEKTWTAIAVALLRKDWSGLTDAA
jgi:HK97 family phage portal protein